MGTQKTTNVILLLILLALLANLFAKWQPNPAVASPGNIDDAVTSSPNETPKGYVHVVSHMAAGEVIKVEPQTPSPKPAWDKR